MQLIRAWKYVCRLLSFNVGPFSGALSRKMRCLQAATVSGLNFEQKITLLVLPRLAQKKGKDAVLADESRPVLADTGILTRLSLIEYQAESKTQ